MNGSEMSPENKVLDCCFIELTYQLAMHARRNQSCPTEDEDRCSLPYPGMRTGPARAFFYKKAKPFYSTPVKQELPLMLL